VTRLDELFRAIWERPTDSELRLVLADALLEAGDPRGELIQLQQNPRADQEQRVMRLIQQHGLTWLGSLRGAVLPISYELGFLASCVAIDPDAGGRIEWATVHTVQLETPAIDFLFDPVMRSLRRVTGVQDGHLKQLLRAPRRPAQIETTLPWSRLTKLYPRLARMPELQLFTLRGLRLSRDPAARFGALDVDYTDGLQRLLESLPSNALTSLIVRLTADR
jgi:uncharacterized protein (TIGR02996 family)